jgi:hypothetical protein
MWVHSILLAALTATALGSRTCLCLSRIQQRCLLRLSAAVSVVKFASVFKCNGFFFSPAATLESGSTAGVNVSPDVKRFPCLR